jgi:hypothetical protein
MTDKKRKKEKKEECVDCDETGECEPVSCDVLIEKTRG